MAGQQAQQGVAGGRLPLLRLPTLVLPPALRLLPPALPRQGEGKEVRSRHGGAVQGDGAAACPHPNQPILRHAHNLHSLPVAKEEIFGKR